MPDDHPPRLRGARPPDCVRPRSAPAGSGRCPAPQPATAITVYKSASCGCCAKWVDHLRAERLRACRARRGGHGRGEGRDGRAQGRALVPHRAARAATWSRATCPPRISAGCSKERPAVAGLAVPGMPESTPGMAVPGAPPEPYEVLAFDAGRQDHGLRAGTEAAGVQGRSAMAEVVTYRDEWRGEFERLNREWIETWFTLEDADRETLPRSGGQDPRAGRGDLLRGGRRRGARAPARCCRTRPTCTRSPRWRWRPARGARLRRSADGRRHRVFPPGRRAARW